MHTWNAASGGGSREISIQINRHRANCVVHLLPVEQGTRCVSVFLVLFIILLGLGYKSSRA